jgi:glucose/arabinose dehydrogenase
MKKIIAAAAIALLVTAASAQMHPDVYSFQPEKRPATDERIASLKLPEGFRINVFARDLGNARMIAVDQEGTVYLTCPRQNRVLALRDPDGDGVAEVRPALQGLRMVHGILLHEGAMYLAAPRTVWRVPMNSDGTFGEPRVIINDLPDGGQHPNRTLGAGPDGKLYISIGSSCNTCDESNPEHATILQCNFDGTNRGVFASGLRNTIGFAWHPETRRMWEMDQGSDWRGNDVPPEELNLLMAGKNYGWPYVFGKRQLDPLEALPPEIQMTKEQFAQQTEPSVLEYPAHSSPIGMVFYQGSMFPAPYRGSAFITFRGSWNRFPPSGYKVAFLRFENGQPVGFEDFITGFLIEEGKAHFGRLSGIAVAADGSLLFADDSNGLIYRVAYKP